jgi:hypothetical protein
MFIHVVRSACPYCLGHIRSFSDFIPADADFQSFSDMVLQAWLTTCSY